MSSLRMLIVGVTALALAAAAVVIPAEGAQANVVCLGDGTTPPTIVVPTPALEGEPGDTGPLRELVVACGTASDPIGAAWELQWSAVDPLPAGMQLTGQANHQIRGIPQVAGLYTITIQAIATNVLDSAHPVTLTRDITVLARPRFSGWSIPTAVVGEEYHAGLYGYGSGVSAANPLPPGLTLADDGAFAGVPEYVPGSGDSTSYSFRAAVNGAAATRLFAITVESSTPTITTASLAEGWMGAPYSQTLTAPHGADWAASGLPQGLSISGDRIVGTPLEAGTFAVTVTASRGESYSTSSTLELRVLEGASLADTALPRAVRGVPYDLAFTIAGDDVLFSGSTDAPGLVVADGRLRGTPQTPGSYDVEVTVENAGASVSRSFVLVVSDPGYTISQVQAAPGQAVTFAAAGLPAGDEFEVTLAGSPVLTGVTASAEGTVSRDFTVPGLAPGAYLVETSGATVPGSLALTVSPVLEVSLPEAHYGAEYTGRIDSRYGGAVAVAAGSTLPAGLQLLPDGTLEGTAIYDGVSAALLSRTIPITVNGIAAGEVLLDLVLDPPALDALDPPRAVVGSPYAFTLPAHGVGAELTVSGELPDGLELVDGELVGTPLEAGEFAFSVSAENLAGRASRGYLLVVTRPSVSLSTASVAAGGQLAVRGDGFPADAEVAIWVHSDPVLLRSATSDADGRIEATVTIPASLAPGVHRIEVRTAAGSYWGEVTVTAGLARSGADPLGALVLVLVLVGGGVLLRRFRVHGPADPPG